MPTKRIQLLSISLHFNSCHGREASEAARRSSGDVKPPHWNPKYKVILASFGRETPGCICAFASGIKWEIKRAKTMKFDVCFLQLRSKRNLWSGHWLVDVSTVTFTAGTCISCCPRARCPWRCNTADEGPDLLSLLAWQETSSWRGKKKKRKEKATHNKYDGADFFLCLSSCYVN